MRESSEDATICLDEFSQMAIQAFITFLHTDNFDVPFRDRSETGEDGRLMLLEKGRLCLAVHQLAERYGVFRLRMLALEALETALCSSTTLPLFEEAVALRPWDDEMETFRACWEACRQHWSEIISDYGDQLDGLVRRCPELAGRLLRGASLGPLRSLSLKPSKET
eukprot:gnl/TRDRNA2_/TRDRNA2_126267_c0_seq1.p1 gnl/TRDRNA2_/TRDRNA2_126267_c0~~gnl/TRDRNA2_/TRDRNA2_126267_c0_seq1.p1  ORF type:complete len:166 (+),score=19.69 gnl/TRDRNA2_/TRDRNA2_126267_c0_seq1:276-773(+)